VTKQYLKHFFDRVVLINLKRRPDRLAQAKEALSQCKWPFRQPIVFAAVDGNLNPPPRKFKDGVGAWGCTCSHQEVLAQATRDGINSILILEDDVCFSDDFRSGVEEFLQSVPDDWDGLMLGGEHSMFFKSKPTLVRPGLYRCGACERTHCYAVRGKYMHMLCRRLRGGGKFNGSVINDYIMARDPELQLAHKIYAPEYFLAGQERSMSDHLGGVLPRQFWNPPGPELSVINLHCAQPLAAALRSHGWFTGNNRDNNSDIEKRLLEIFLETKKNRVARLNKLREWIKGMQWQVGYDPDFICTVWHPEASPQLVKDASLWRVYEVTANTVNEALKQIPQKLKRPVLSVFS